MSIFENTTKSKVLKMLLISIGVEYLANTQHMRGAEVFKNEVFKNEVFKKMCLNQRFTNNF